MELYALFYHSEYTQEEYRILWQRLVAHFPVAMQGQEQSIDPNSAHNATFNAGVDASNKAGVVTPRPHRARKAARYGAMRNVVLRRKHLNALVTTVLYTLVAS